MEADKKRTRSAQRTPVGGRQILIVVAVAVLATGVMILLNSDILRSSKAGGFGDVPTGVTAEGDPYLGLAGAPLQMVVYSDYLCSHCRDWSDVLQEISAKWVASGKLQIIDKNYAFLTPESTLAAQAAECALDQGADAFWRFHDKAFAAQDLGLAGYTPSALEGYAEEIGLDTDKFGQCLDNGSKAEAVQADLDAGVSAGVRGTPSWFLNGEMVAGMLPADNLEAMLAAALGK